MATPSISSIDDVIDALDEIIDWAREHHSRLGYFPALYRKVTVKVKEGITDGHFEDGERMERLDVIFARRYLEAFWAHRQGQATTRAWQLAFDVGQRYWPIVLQHLLLGINAHINLDLGVAASQTVAPERLNDLRGDYERINGILAGLVGEVERELNEIWPLTAVFGQLLGNVEDRLINFSLTLARDESWRRAEALSEMSPSEQSKYIDRVDREVATLGRVIHHPGLVLGLATKIIRLGETQNVVKVIDILS